MNVNKRLGKGANRSTGEFFTSVDLAQYVGAKILSFIKPDVLLEPYAGEGDLLQPFIDKNIPSIANDIDSDNVSNLEEKYNSRLLTCFNQDFITVNISDIKSKWIKIKEKSVLIYTNPPFGTRSTNKLATKLSENNGEKSRNISINYGSLDKYGKGDLILPAMGKIINLLHEIGHGYLAFYSPLGLFCKRRRYLKLLNAILEDFEFIWGEIFPGSYFNNVNKRKPICVTLWKYNKQIDYPITSISFNYEKEILALRPVPLLKDYWRYDTRKFIRGEIAVQGNDRFNVMAPKMFHLLVSKGGSEVVPENLIKPLNLGFIPDELAIGLWSVAVGYRSLTNYPLYMDNANVHLPDFKNNTVQEILVLVILFVLLIEYFNQYTHGKIGNNKNSSFFQFGNQSLSKGVNDLLNSQQKYITEDETLDNCLQILKTDSINDSDYKIFRKYLKSELERKINQIGYWDFIPISME